jgi:3-hydroxyisobutyrate dehydrogenase
MDGTPVERTPIGWIGTGVMGASMCGHLLAAGHPVRVHNRTRERADALVEAGAVWCDTPGEVAAGSDVTFSIVGYPDDVRSVILGPGGVLEHAAAGSAIVDMTTSEPTLAREIFDAAAARGVEALDAPVSGGDVGARSAALVIMVGGTESGFARVLPLLERLGQKIVHEGGPGAGQHTKMMNQIAIAGGMIAVCEALLYAAAAGLDLEQALETISGGAAGSWSLTNYAPRILRGDLEPGFKIDHFLKDLGIALAEAGRLGLSLPATALAEQLYRAARAQGYGGKGTQALVAALAALSARPTPRA